MQSLSDLESLRAQLSEDLDRARNLRETVSRNLRLGRADSTQMAAIAGDVQARELELADVDRQIADAKSDVGVARRRTHAARIRKMHGHIFERGAAAVEAARFADAHLGLAAHQIRAAVQAMQGVAAAGGALLGTVRPDRLRDSIDPALANAGAAMTQALAQSIAALVSDVPGLSQYVEVRSAQYNPRASSMVDTVAAAVRHTDRRMAEFAASVGVDVHAVEEDLV
jgi:hypothetical protein